MQIKYLKIIAYLFITILFFSCDSSDSRKNEESSSGESRNSSQNQERKKCSNCDGTGVYTCTMCDGTGKNNMGMDCGCVTYVANSIAMGYEPNRTALQWTCESCDGTGYKN